jgi:hypothetical protein
MKKRYLYPVIKLLSIALIIELGIVVVIGVLGWRIGWESLGEYASAIELAGIFAPGIGLLGIKGNWDSTHSFQYQYSLSVTRDGNWERTKLTIQDFLQTYIFLVVMIFVGGLSLLVGLIISLYF